MKQRFSSFVESNQPCGPTLPIVHTTDWYVLRDLIDGDRKLKPMNCPVFGERLSYFFYGKPCYRKHIGEDPNSLSAFYLVGIILRAEVLGKFVRMFPFDSGAYVNGFYDSSLHPQMDVNDFSLKPEMKTAEKTVSTFFENNENYMKGIVANKITPSVMDIEVEAYLSIVGDKSKTKSDDRRGAIEFQVSDEIIINKRNVLAVILPEQLLDDKFVRDFIEVELGAKPLHYLCPHARPSEDARAIIAEANRFYKSEGFYG
ncbi:hypothetical protein [Cohaesibacter gelatinilyticus]|uniref:Uncharacterized protein n=1 Tax=Cohaesibacter gelatinilyticus TaxID=372072 RepID=A0A285NHV8_9HYPH|nr:hypothetical protein [Cohaesibacter gelatinilyticus]SNZ07241.1 hypothetical protein SAMN06265368_0758 [Cohaesibacter gelatinilyticus]